MVHDRRRKAASWFYRINPPATGGGEIYLIKGPQDIGLLTISEQNIINSNS